MLVICNVRRWRSRGTWFNIRHSPAWRKSPPLSTGSHYGVAWKQQTVPAKISLKNWGNSPRSVLPSGSTSFCTLVSPLSNRYDKFPCKLITIIPSHLIIIYKIFVRLNWLFSSAKMQSEHGHTAHSGYRVSFFLSASKNILALATGGPYTPLMTYLCIKVYHISFKSLSC